MCCYVTLSNTSLGALVPNSRDQQEKQWRPDFMHHKTHPKIRLFEKSRLKCTSNTINSIALL